MDSKSEEFSGSGSRGFNDQSSSSMDAPPPYAEYDTQRQRTSPYDQPSNWQVPGSSLGPYPSTSRPAISGKAQHLQQLIAIPATAATLGSPFIRAYPPVLESFNISRGSFLDFLDGLNRVAVQSPPLQVLGLAGNLVGFVPLATAQIVGTAVNLAAKVGTFAASKGGTEIYLRKANKEIFGPCGLKVETAKLEAVARLAGAPILDATGSITSDAQSLDPAAQGGNIGQNWLRALQPWIAPLDETRLAPVDTNTNILGKLHTMASERQRAKDEKRVGRRAGKNQKESDKAWEDLEKEMRKLGEEEDKARRKEHGRKLEKELRKIDEDRQKAERKYEEEMAKLGEDIKKKDDKQTSKLLWLVVRNIDASDGPSLY
ncbi:hypothetical protein F5Y16DRAFT_359526 [Xylariaceae sp. FL0255]|nr:hypothetical protein F5Y16DRAFT_359526 [Xylariaceae sp. FL0255]